MSFGGNQITRGHPLTVVRNDPAVMVGSTRNATRIAAQQTEIADALAAGATILVCPMCVECYGVSEADLLPGLKVGNPDATGGALFADGTQTLTCQTHRAFRSPANQDPSGPVPCRGQAVGAEAARIR